MSIQDELREHVYARRIMYVKPLFGPNVRHVYATAEVFEQLDERTADERFHRSAAQLKAWLDNFSRGNRIVVGDRKSKTCDMKRLDTSGDLWEIRKRNTPSTRIFGHFIEPDCFLALGVHLVTDLFEGSAGWISKNWLGQKIREYFPNWGREIRNAKAEWRRLFPAYTPHTAETLNDYISRAQHENDLK
jgi:hypothetical protein